MPKDRQHYWAPKKTRWRKGPCGGRVRRSWFLFARDKIHSEHDTYKPISLSLTSISTRHTSEDWSIDVNISVSTKNSIQTKRPKLRANIAWQATEYQDQCVFCSSGFNKASQDFQNFVPVNDVAVDTTYQPSWAIDYDEIGLTIRSPMTAETETML